MNKLILSILLLVGNLSFAVTRTDDDPGSISAAGVVDGKNGCKCDIKADNNDPASTKPRKVQAQQQANLVLGNGSSENGNAGSVH